MARFSLASNVTRSLESIPVLSIIYTEYRSEAALEFTTPHSYFQSIRALSKRLLLQRVMCSSNTPIMAIKDVIYAISFLVIHSFIPVNSLRIP